MSQQWTPPPSSDASANIPNYLIPAILTVFCCMPLAVISIVFATQVNSKIAAGDIAGATESSAKAKKFMFIALGLGILTWIIVVILCFVFGIGMTAINM